MLCYIIAYPAAHLHGTKHFLRGSSVIQIWCYLDIIQNWLLRVKLGIGVWPFLAMKSCDAKIIKRLFFLLGDFGRVNVIAKQAGDFIVGDRFGGDDFVNIFELVLLVDGIRRRDVVTHCDTEDIVVLVRGRLAWGREDVFWDDGVVRLIEVFGRKMVEGGEEGDVSFNVGPYFGG